MLDRNVYSILYEACWNLLTLTHVCGIYIPYPSALHIHLFIVSLKFIVGRTPSLTDVKEKHSNGSIQTCAHL